MEKYNYNVEDMNQGAVTWAVSRRELIVYFVGILSISAGCFSKDLWQLRCRQTITAILPGSKWSVLLLRIVVQDAMSEVCKVNPQLKLHVYADG